MDYIQHQDDAKAENRWLLIAFGVIITIVAATAAAVVTALLRLTFVVLQIYNRSSADSGSFGEPVEAEPLAELPWGWIFVGACLTVGAVIIGVSRSRERSLVAFGGVGIARSVGGRHIHNQSDNLGERRFVNAVEEIAIAARQPLPAVFVLDRENGINAFNAGWTPESTVIGITSGALHELTRDELQAVAAQAMSHVFHGDARLNMRLMALVTGVAGIAIIGEDWVENSRTSERQREEGVFVPLFVAGQFLRGVGWIGVWLSNSVQRFVARRHEFLADATAVELLRQSEPMRDALRRIGAHQSKSHVRVRRARAISHLFMADTRGRHKGGVHPDLRLRILRLDPSWTGEWLSGSSELDSDPRGWSQVPLQRDPSTPAPAPQQSIIPGVDALNPLESIVEPFQSPVSGLMSDHNFSGSDGAGLLAPMMGAAVADEVLSPAPRPATHGLDAGQALALVSALVHRATQTPPSEASVLHPCSVESVQAAANALDRMTTIDRPALLGQAGEVLAASGETSTSAHYAEAVIAPLKPEEDLDHWLLRRLILLNLVPAQAPTKSRRIDTLRHEYALALSFLTAIGGGDTMTSFAVGSRAAGFNGLAPRRVRGFRDLDKALSRLRLIHPGERTRALAGFEAAMEADMRRQPPEFEFIAIITLTLATA